MRLNRVMSVVGPLCQLCSVCRVLVLWLDCKYVHVQLAQFVCVYVVCVCMCMHACVWVHVCVCVGVSVYVCDCVCLRRCTCVVTPVMCLQHSWPLK